MSEAQPFLKRAQGLLSSVESKLGQLNQHMITHNQNLDQVSSVGDWFVGLQGARQIRQEKARLVSDLQLAWSEMEKCQAIDANAQLETSEGIVTLKSLRTAILYGKGQVEMAAGSAAEAKRFFTEALQELESPDAHFMLGLLHEGEYNPPEALKHFERCLELAPDGEFSVAALREANEMRNYRKRFRGSWGMLLLLVVVCFPIAPVYFLLKYR